MSAKSDAGLFGLLGTLQIYMTGHGGDEFIKFHDTSELMAQDLADALLQMNAQHRCVELCC